MNYEDCVEKLYSHSFFIPKKMNLDFMKKFSRDFNAPEKQFPTIHIAGTNGKGSSVVKIASALTKAGYRTGTYTSPHISSFRERTTIDGTPISEEDVLLHLLPLFSNPDFEKASFFELLTMLSFLYFSHEKIDIAIIETGMGGRLDATNILTPILSILTRIADDHSEYLGNTLDKIASEKAGVIKPNTPVLLSAHAQYPSVFKKADLEQAPLYLLSEPLSYERENKAIARKALEIIADRFPTTSSAQRWGLEQRPKCRLEKHHLPQGEVIFDVSHNPDGVKALFGELQLAEKIPMVLGMSKGKEIATSLDIFSSYASHIYLIRSSHHRMAPAEELAKHLKLNNVSFITPTEVPKLKEKQLLISGSFFFMTEVREALGIKEPTDSLDLNGPKLK